MLNPQLKGDSGVLARHFLAVVAPSTRGKGPKQWGCAQNPDFDSYKMYGKKWAQISFSPSTVSRSSIVNSSTSHVLECAVAGSILGGSAPFLWRRAPSLANQVRQHGTSTSTTAFGRVDRHGQVIKSDLISTQKTSMNTNANANADLLALRALLGTRGQLTKAVSAPTRHFFNLAPLLIVPPCCG